MWTYERTVKKGKYLYAVLPEHPKATSKGYVLEHRVVMENKLGRLLQSDEVVHHINSDGHDNRPENLEVMSSREHGKLHAKRSTPVSLECAYCGEVFLRKRNQRPELKKTKRTFCSRRCSGKFYHTPVV